MKSLGKWEAWLLTVVVLMSAAALAQEDPPSRVARLQYISGAVSLQPGGVNDWVDGVLNRPLTTADRVWTDKDSRAELDLGNAVLRTGSETSITLTNVGDNILQVELDQGTLDLRVRRLYDGETYEIDTPNLAFTVMRAGEYRIDVDPDNDMTVTTVWRGLGEATGEGRSVRVTGDRQGRFIEGTSLTHEIYSDPERDGFDDWCRVRDRREDDSRSARYVSPDVIGAEDLDSYGSWRVTPQYGPVWVPAVASGWAPYRDGHWAWIEPWGWTWVDDEPWGFAPFHYGRWVYYGGAWGWVPGPRLVRPVYAPALVAWVGGSGFSVSVSFGQQPAVGWFPLGYGDPYLPPYRGSRNYFRQVNVSNTRITNITQVTNNYYVNNSATTINRTTVVNRNTTIVNNSPRNNVHNNVHIRYANERVPGAVTAVPRNALASSQPVAKAMLRVPPGQWKRNEIALAPPVAPSRASVLGRRAGTKAVAPPSRVATRQVVMRKPAPPRPVPFSVKQEALQHNPGRPLDRDTEQALRTRIARQQVNRPGNVAQQGSFGVRPGNSPEPPMHGREVPRPPARQQMQQAPANNGRNVPHPAMNGNAGRGQQISPAYRNVPRPPEQGNGQRPGFRSFGSAQENSRPVPQAPAHNSRQESGPQSFGSPQNQPHSVPRPPEQDNQPQPGNRNFGSAQPESHSVPQPPANHRVNENGRGPQSGNMQPRYQANPAPANFNRGGNSSGSVARPSNPQPRPEPTRMAQPAARPSPPPAHAERPASRPEPAAESRGHQSSAPSPHGKESKDESKPDKQH